MQVDLQEYLKYRDEFKKTGFYKDIVSGSHKNIDLDTIENNDAAGTEPDSAQTQTSEQKPDTQKEDPKDNLVCRIWAWEQDPNNETAHWCHAKVHRLYGDYQRRGNIEKVLRETPVQIKRMRWTLKGCEPNHDGTACKDCRYKYYKGIYNPEY